MGGSNFQDANGGGRASDSLGKKTMAGVSWGLADKMFTRLSEFLLLIYLAKLLGPESFGLVGILVALATIAKVFVDGGFSLALIQRGASAVKEDFSTVFIITLTSSFLLYGALFFSAALVADFYGNKELVQSSRVLFLIIILDAFVVVPLARLKIDLDFKRIAIANSLSTFVGGAVGLYMAQTSGTYWALIGMSLAKSSSNAVIFTYMSGWTPRGGFSWVSAQGLFGFGSRLLLSTFINTALANLYVLLTGRYYSATQVGYLTQSTRVVDSVSEVMAGVIRTVSFPVLSSVNEDKDKFTQAFKKLIEATLVVTLPVTVGFAMIAAPFVQLTLGAEWTPIVPIITILCVARTVLPISMLNISAINAFGRSDLSLLVDICSIPISVTAILCGIPFGVEGVAWAILTANLICFFMYTYYPGRIFNFGPIAQLRVAGKVIVAGLIMALAVWSVSNANPLEEILLKIFIGSVSYLLALIMLRVNIVLNVLHIMLQRARKRFKVRYR